MRYIGGKNQNNEMGIFVKNGKKTFWNIKKSQKITRIVFPGRIE
jgi:hypothetical protein